MVEFAGWIMPLNYPTGVLAEHRHCREKAVLFDVSHMGQILVRQRESARKTAKSPEAPPGKQFEALTPSAIENLLPGHARYVTMTNDKGGIVDDLIVSNTGEQLFVVVNAATRDQDIAHMRTHLEEKGADVSEWRDRALIAIQGPGAAAVLGEHCPKAVALEFMQTTEAQILNVDCRVSRLGYTGEDGFEISVPADQALLLSELFLRHPDCIPAGLGARDSLRLEAGLCLYGQDITPDTSPVEAGLAWTIHKARRALGDFPGASRILRELEAGPERKLTGILPEGRAPARQGTPVVDEEDREIGVVTSGGFGPSVQTPVSMGYLNQKAVASCRKIYVDIRGKRLPARLTALPFVARRYHSKSNRRET